jgi:hypothetical protein
MRSLNNDNNIYIKKKEAKFVIYFRHAKTIYSKVNIKPRRSITQIHALLNFNLFYHNCILNLEFFSLFDILRKIERY